MDWCGERPAFQHWRLTATLLDIPTATADSSRSHWDSGEDCAHDEEDDIYVSPDTATGRSVSWQCDFLRRRGSRAMTVEGGSRTMASWKSFQMVGVQHASVASGLNPAAATVWAVRLQRTHTSPAHPKRLPATCRDSHGNARSRGAHQPNSQPQGGPAPGPGPSTKGHTPAASAQRIVFPRAERISSQASCTVGDVALRSSSSPWSGGSCTGGSRAGLTSTRSMATRRLVAAISSQM